MNKKPYFILCLSLIAAPIVCNLIVGAKNITNIEAVGTSVDWLSFFGSYIGAVIATLTSFYILKAQMEQAEKNFFKERRHQEIIKTIDDLADRFSKYSPAEAIRLSRFTDITNDSLKEELGYLQVSIEKYKAMGYTAVLLYGNEEKDSPGFEFFKEYSLLIGDTVQCISDAIKITSDQCVNYKTSQSSCFLSCSDKGLQKYKDKMFAIAQRIEALDIRSKYVLELANKYQLQIINNFNSI